MTTYPPFLFPVSGPGALLGHLLTSTGNGLATWQLPGAVSSRVTAIAAVIIPALHAVAINALGLAYPADSSLITDASRVVGVSVSAALPGEPVQIAVDEVLATPAVWTPGPLFVGVAGALSSLLTGASYQLQLGVALTASSLLVRPQFPIML